MNNFNLRGRLMQIANVVTGTIQAPPTVPEEADDTIETPARTIERLRKTRLDRKWVQITASFSRWVSDLLSDIPKGEIDDPDCWEMKRGTDLNGQPISWLGIKGATSIYIGGTEVCLDQIQFAVQGLARAPGTLLGGAWMFIDNEETLDHVVSNSLRYGVVDNCGRFIEVHNQKHLADLLAHEALI